MDEVGLGQVLQNARKKAGLTQQDLCHKAGLSYSTLAKIERGAIKAPSIFTIQSVAGALDLSLGELLGEQPQRTSDRQLKRSKSGVRFVYFDINGCLVRFYNQAFTKLSEETTQTSDMIENVFWHYNDAVCRGEMSMQEFNKIFGTKIGVKNLNWDKYYLEAIEPIQEMHELVKWAVGHYKVGLLSNIMPGQIDSMLQLGLLPDIEYSAIIDSSKTGAIKPEPKIYEAAQYYTNCSPNEILLVDDSRANIMGAEKLDWRVLWFDDYRPDESADRIRTTLEFE
jgi:FMN phosphatase YigB (HAD superfamily)/DNA-binding Xre family transcriptional regulator